MDNTAVSTILMWMPWIPTALSAAWAGRIVQQRLHRRYPVLLLLLIFLLATFIGLHWLHDDPERLNLYKTTWLIYYCAYCSFFPFILLEMANKVLAAYRGFHRLGVALLRGGLAVSGAAIAGLWLFAPQDWVDSGRKFFQFESHTIWGSLLLAWLVFYIFVRYFRLEMPQNVRLIFGVLAGLLAGNAVFMGFFSSSSSFIAYAIFLVWSSLCYVIAIWRMSPAGETEAKPVRIRADSETAAAAAAHLESLNRSLIRMLKR